MITLHRLVVAANVAWTIWALVGGIYFIAFNYTNTAWVVFHDKTVHGYTIIGVSLLLCAATSFIGICQRRAAKAAALLCAAWCGATAISLEFATPVFDESKIDAWLLLMCAFTCVMRWAILVLEPHVYK